MKCYKCPMIKDEFDMRIQRLDNFCGLIEYDEAEYNHVDYCYCEKMGGKLNIVGRCSDAERMTEEEWKQYREEYGLPSIEDEYIDLEDYKTNTCDLPQQTKIQRKRNRDKKYKEHLKRISDYGNYPPPSYPVDENGDYCKDNPVRYKRFTYKPGKKKYLRKLSNNKVRKAKDLSSKGSGYRRLFDYWWSLW